MAQTQITQSASQRTVGDTLNLILFGNRFRQGLLRQLLVYGALIVMAGFFLLPFYWMLNTALKPINQVLYAD